MNILVSRIIPIFILGLFFCLLIFAKITQAQAAGLKNDSANGLPLSGMHIKITSKGHTATFRLYDTVAAKQFYAQLPLSLDLDNFHDAQWMFYPPEKLSVTKSEAYHDGKKGELSYYAPWGDVVMFYGSFGSASGLYELGKAVQGNEHIRTLSGTIRIEK